MTIIGLPVLVPLYYAVPSSHQQSTHNGWYRYCIQHLEQAPEAYKHRLWVPAWLMYIYAAYFCQLMYTEYDSFSKLRLAHLTKVGWWSVSLTVVDT
jgi:hypothetical protein